MALVVNDRVKETSTTAGTGTFTLNGAVTGFETFSSAIGNSNTTYYAIEIPNTTEFEVGLGTVAAGTLARTTVISSSNSDALVNFSAGTKNVFCTLPASKATVKDADGRIGIGKTTPTAALEIGGSGDGNLQSFRVNASTNSEWFSVGVAGAGIVRFNSQGGVSQVGGAGSIGARMNIAQLSSSAAALALAGGQANNILEVNSANSDLGGDLMVIDQNGLVGIGTSSPSSLLHLSSSDPQLTITDTDGTGSQVIKAAGDDLEFNVVGKTIIDSDNGGTLQLVDGGTSYLKFFEFGNYAALESMISDNDFKIRGNDGGSFFDALTFDMSDEGFAEFNSKIRVEADSSANAILVKGRSADDIGTIKFTANDGSGNQGELSARSSVFIFNTPTQTNFRINNTDKLTLTSSQINLKDNVFVDVNEQIQFGDAGENISGDGTDLTIASSNKIILNADGAGQVFFKDGGTNLAKLFVSSQVFTLETIISDGDFAIKGNDGGSSVTALSLDMSEAGAATFNDKIILGANKAIEFGDAGESISGDGTDMTITGNIVKIDAANRIILDAAENRIDLHDNGSEFARFVNNGGQLRILTGSSAATAVSFDSSGAATFNSDVTVGSKLKLPTNTANKILVADGTSFEEVDISGDATIASGGALTLANSGVSAASYTAANITVDAKGRVTSASNGSAGVSAGFAVAMAIAL